MSRFPEDPEAERSLLSTLCAQGNDAVAYGELSRLSEHDFIVPAHRAVFQAACKVSKDGDEISLMSIYDALVSMGLAAKAGERTGLVHILSGDEVGRPDVLVKIIQSKRKQRDLMALGARITREAESLTPAEVIEMAGSELSRMAQSSEKGNAEEVATFSDEALAMVLDRIDGRSRHGVKMQGWNRLNGLLQGFQPGNLVVLAARPGIGKTALVLNWFLRAGMNGFRCLFVTIEMSKEELWNRMVSDKSSVNYREMVAGRDRKAFQQFAGGKMELDSMPLHVCDRGKITSAEIVSQMDKIITKFGSLDFVIIDYLQLMKSPEGSKSQSETTRIGEITRDLKLAAKDRKVPIVLLSQLNREVEKRQAGKPQLSDLRDSGCIEQDADIVMFIHRKMDEMTAELVLAKHRNGPTMDLPLVFLPEFTRYVEVERETVESKPSLGYLSDDFL